MNLMDQKTFFIILLGFLIGFLISFFVFFQISNTGSAINTISSNTNVEFYKNTGFYKINSENKDIYVVDYYFEEFINIYSSKDNALRKPNQNTNNIILENCHCILTGENAVYIMETCDCKNGTCQNENASCKDSVSTE